MLSSRSLVAACQSLQNKRVTIGIRHLYSASALGIDNYIKTRDKVKNQFHNMEGKFKAKMLDFCHPESGNMIFTEDLKHIVHLVETNDEDLNLVQQMMSKFSQQNKELRFGSFIFGPVVMRMYHFLNKPTQALEVFKDEKMDGFFDQLISFQILMDLLLKNEMYQDVIDTFDSIKKKQLQGSKYPKNCVVLVLAACYKMNTPESFEYAKKLWSELNKVGHNPMRRAGTFAAALAIAQKSPHIALEILTSMKQQTYVTVRNLKVAALADLGRPDDALPIMRSVLEFDGATESKRTFASDIIEKVQQSVDKMGKKELTDEFQKIEKQLRSLGHITAEPLSVQLCAEIIIPNNPQFREHQQRYSDTSKRSRSQYVRPGLQEMI